MDVSTITELTQEDLSIRIEGRSIIFLAPRFRSRNALLAWFTERNGSENTFYYSLFQTESSFSSFITNWIESIQDFDPKFGTNTTQALAQRNAKPQDIVDAFVADLSKSKSKPHLLVIDNFDLLTISDDVVTFFEGLATKLPRGLQVIINSRTLSYVNWSALIRSGHAVVLGDDHTIDGGIFDPQKPDLPHLEVYGLAGGSVYVNGLPLTTWDGPLPRNLFYYFVDHPMVTRDDIFETFWPDLPTKEATNVFHVTKRKISERLGYELTSYSGGFYRPSDQIIVHYDVQRFESAIKVGDELQTVESPVDWYKAIRFYRSPFLHRLEMPWIEKRRNELRLAYANALIGVGRLYKAQGDAQQAISYYQRGLREIPEREDIHRDIMTIYHSIGETDHAIAQYRLLQDLLKRNLGITPSKPTRALYASITGNDSAQ